MNPVIYSIVHLTGLFVLAGYTFYAFAAPAETRKSVMMITGIASLVVLVSGFGLQAKYLHAWPAWLFVKMACWLALSALAGFGYRKRAAAGTLAVVAILIILLAVTMVYLRPFQA